MINDNKVFQSIHYPLPTKERSTPIIMKNDEIMSTTMMVLKNQFPPPSPPPPPPPPMVVSPTGSPFTLQRPPTKKLRCNATNNKRRVYFGNDITLAYIESSCEITKEEKGNRWYQSIELESFKQSARSLCRERIFRNNNKEEDEDENNSDSSQSQDQNQVEVEENSTDENETDSLRGMGVYYPSRVRYCKKYIKHVLVAYHVKCGPTNKEHVALLATKWSSKNQQRAVETGTNDFCAAYDISMPIAQVQTETQENIE
jgi:hypothetical protein